MGEKYSDRAALFLFHDGECALCRRLREWIETRDREGRICFVSLGEEGLEERFPQVDVARARVQLTACDGSGQVYEGLSALRQVGRRLPGVRRLDWIYELPGARQMVGGAYRAVNRYRKGPCLQCGEAWMPSKKHSQRRRGRR